MTMTVVVTLISMPSRVHRPRGKSDDGRLRRKIGTETVGLYADVTPDVKRRIDEYAKASGFPVWAVVEAAIRAGTPGPDGYPSNWPLPPEVEIKSSNYDSDLTELAAEAAGDGEVDAARVARGRSRNRHRNREGSEAA